MYLHDTLNCTIELSNIFKNSKFSLNSLISYGIDLNLKNGAASQN